MIARSGAVAVVMLVLAACGETATETAEDVARARIEATERLLAARRQADAAVARADDEVADAEEQHVDADAGANQQLAKVQAAAMVSKAQAAFEVATAEAQGRYAIAEEKCDALEGVDKIACFNAADAELAIVEAAAVADRDEALLRAARHD